MTVPHPRILVIDDHDLVRAGARAVLEASVPDAVVDDVDSIASALRLADEAPAVVVLDVRLQGLSGIEGLVLLKKRWPQTPVVMLSSYADPDTIAAALDAA